jgi:hypothetical protein
MLYICLHLTLFLVVVVPFLLQAEVASAQEMSASLSFSMLSTG